MAEIEITLPTVQYGNVKIRATPEELGLKTIADPGDLGYAAAIYLNLFTQAFKEGAKADVTTGVAAPQGASQPVTEEQAQRMLDEGLGGVSEVDDEAEDARTGDEYTKAGSDPAPWNNPKVDAKPKPWETGSAAPAKPVVDSDW